MKTRREYIKTYRVKAKDLSTPSEISKLFNENHIVSYVYEFRYLGQVLKYGQSNSGIYLGERVYRQLCHLVKWPRLYYSTSGMESLSIRKEYTKETGLEIQKDNLEIFIHDMTTYPYEYSGREHEELLRFEAEMINEHTKLHGCRPIGNVNDELIHLHIEGTPDKVMSIFFDISKPTPGELCHYGK